MPMMKRYLPFVIVAAVGLIVFGGGALLYRARLAALRTAPKVMTAEEKAEPIVCPVCGAFAVQEKCKMICRSEVCRGRVILNCSEF